MRVLEGAIVVGIGAALWIVAGSTVAGPAPSGIVKCNADVDGGSTTDDLAFKGSGSNRISLMANGQVSSHGFFGNANNLWDFKGCGQLGSTGMASDAPAVGATRIQLFNAAGTGIDFTAYLATGGGIWELAQLADVDGDGDLDLIYVGVSGGAFGLLRINIIQNGAPTGVVGFRPTAGGFWVLIAAGDLNGDGTDDLIFQSASSVRVDFMNGTAVLFQGFLSNGGGVWTVAAVGDASGDGKEDLWWVGENGTAAQDLSRLQEMDGASVLSTIYPQTGGGSLVPMFIADANGDNVGDLFLAGATVNRLDVMTGASLSISVARFFGNGGGTYVPSLTGDFNGDGKQDLASEGPNDVLVQVLDGDQINPVIAQSQIPNGTGFWDLFLD